MADSCVFCREISGSKDTNFASIYPEFESRYLYESNSLIAFPCIGQLTEGHFLIAPKYHQNTFRSLLSKDGNIGTEASSFINKIHHEQKYKVEDSLIFEHGAISQKDGGCGIYHAHIHIVPNARNVSSNEVFHFSSKPSKSIELALMGLGEGETYVLAGNYREGFFVEVLNQPLPSQTLRRNVAKALGIDKWDWREARRESGMLKLLRVNG